MRVTKFSSLLLKTFREPPKNVTNPVQSLLLQAGLLVQLDSGVYIYNTPMVLYLEKLTSYVHSYMSTMFNRVYLPTLTPITLWQQSGRYDKYAEKFGTGSYILSPTCEESVTYLGKTFIKSYKDLPKAVYQITNKYRDELRPQAGLIRTKEFSMKDGYSFHATKEDLISFYDSVRCLYCNLFDSLAIPYDTVEADNGDIGGSKSLEFLIDGVEVAHIFQLDTKYSESLGLYYMAKNNSKELVYMGCYGIGISRLAQLLLRSSDKGLVFPRRFTPYDYVVLNEDYDLIGSVLLDDRNCSFGVKIKDAELMGLGKIIV
ncbi:MAG: hypothetical protein IM613_12630 [Cytophagales bacterium]|nr:hypothetical protein [Cytophagales bacterium]